MRPSIIVTLALSNLVQALDLTSLTQFLIQRADAEFPTLKGMGQDIYDNPELGRAEFHAHDLAVNHFSSLHGWKVTPHAYSLETAYSFLFEHRPEGFHGELKTIGILAEYDALTGINGGSAHACGHNLIATNAWTVGILASQALVHYNIPGILQIVGCPDEENASGKHDLEVNGAFDGFELAFMAHPTSASSVQVMEGRINSFYTMTGATHAEAVKKAYSAMVTIDQIHDDLPGTGSTAVSIANIGDYATNVVQQNISLGFAGAEKRTVQQIVSELLGSGNFPKVNATITEDQDGVVLAALGPGGHASESTRGALELTTATFEALSDDSSITYFLPGNTTFKQYDITCDMRTRYTTDLAPLAEFVDKAIGSLAHGVSHDIVYPSLEIIPSLANAFVNLIETPEYGLTDFVIGPDIAASTDASWCELPVLDPETHELLSVKRAVLHANYRICEKVPGALCAFNHEPLFHNVSGTDFAYDQTKIVARAEAQLIIEALSNDTFYEELTALVV
ncbi:uncharacterized protein FIESC28_03401 [Fusarium coffeatum]|uniref:Peptidase M20 dimerisation domain-containing protein n=1 Tax=Fusarium coffeatum TaxID=231269 RepID=A0A366S559_9HYPO|nr:uncharacterized protein FIESC28_03401 [Fusarium coffeatum]RBR23785.1 hypothetical protein FIESC28_03401 [Fusarium coffeatum]